MALARVLNLQERYDEAIETYKHAVEMRPGDWKTWLSLAGAYQWSGRDPAKVPKLYRKTLELATPQLRRRQTILIWSQTSAAYTLRCTTPAMPFRFCAKRWCWRRTTRMWWSELPRDMSCWAIASRH